MTCYVDDMCNAALGRYSRMKMSHLFADTVPELLAMVTTIGVSPRYIQKANDWSRVHFDICKSKRTLALNAGAIPVTMRVLATMVSYRRFAKCAKLPDPVLVERVLAYRIRERLDADTMHAILKGEIPCPTLSEAAGARQPTTPSTPSATTKTPA